MSAGTGFGTWTDPTSDLMYRGAMPYLLAGLPAGESVVDLGGGSGLSRLWWPRQPVDITTVDSDPDTHPDVLADILTYAHAGVADTVLLRYVLHYLTDWQVRDLFAQIARWHRSNVIVVQFANTRPYEKTENSADSGDRVWRTPGALLRLLGDLPAWVIAPAFNRIDYTVRPDFYASRLGRAGRYPHAETLLGLSLDRRVT